MEKKHYPKNYIIFIIGELLFCIFLYAAFGHWYTIGALSCLVLVVGVALFSVPFGMFNEGY